MDWRIFILAESLDVQKSRRDAYENYQNLPDDVAAGWPAVIVEALTVDSVSLSPALRLGLGTIREPYWVKP